MKKTIFLSMLTASLALSACGKKHTDTSSAAAASAPASVASSGQKVTPAKYNPNLQPGTVVWADEATKKRFERIQAEAAARKAAAQNQGTTSQATPAR